MIKCPRSNCVCINDFAMLIFLYNRKQAFLIYYCLIFLVISCLKFWVQMPLCKWQCRERGPHNVCEKALLCLYFGRVWSFLHIKTEHLPLLEVEGGCYWSCRRMSVCDFCSLDECVCVCPPLIELVRLVSANLLLSLGEGRVGHPIPPLCFVCLCWKDGIAPPR